VHVDIDVDIDVDIEIDCDDRPPLYMETRIQKYVYM
jgi:hypothetical protein